MRSSEHRPGDKVALRLVDGVPRALILEMTKKGARVQTNEGEIMQVGVHELRNFSAAARTAWKSMPARKVGRPRGSAGPEKVSVTLRFDKAVWELFQELERSRKVKNRNILFNELLLSVTNTAHKAKSSGLDAGWKGSSL